MAHLPIWYLGQVPDEEGTKAFKEFKLIPPKNATMGVEGETLDTSNRNTTVRFAEKDNWFGQNMFQYGMKASLECKWNFHLTDFEAVQFAEYGVGQHYNWHIDTFMLAGRGYDRKVTVVCLLNDPSEFEGGQFKMRFNRQEYVVPLVKNTAIAFPSFIEHCVTPVTSGVRYTATMWVNGPEFK